MKKLLIGLILGVLAATAVPALATHVTEPTTPITGLRIRVWNYASDVSAPCDGGEFTFGDLRIGAWASSDTFPSEHFNAVIIANRHVPDAKRPWILRLHREWAVTWLHSNIPPHPKLNQRGWAISDDVGTAIWNLRSKTGLWEIRVVVVGLESGNVYDQTCMFTVPESF